MADQPLIDISPENWRIVRDILQRHVPDREVWAFGSRAKWTAKEFSDLDIAVIGEEQLSIGVMAELTEAFQESALPFKVDVVDWAAITPSFQKVVEASKVILRSLRHSERKTVAEVPIDTLTDGSPITYGVVKPGAEVEGGVLFIRGGDVVNGKILTEQLRTISREVSSQYSRTLLSGGELLISLVGNPGEVALVAPELKGANIARQVGLVRLCPTKVEPDYVQYFLRSSVGRERLFSHSKGSVQQVINLGDLKTLRIPLPERNEQIAIAETMRAFDDRIVLLQETNATLEAIAQALFKSWFVDFDPVRAKAEGREPEGVPPEIAQFFPSGFEDSELGEIPKGWKAGCLGDVVSILDSKRIPLSGKQRAERQGIYPYYGAASVMDYVDDYLFDGVHVLMGEDGSVANPDGTPILQYVWGKFWANNHAHVLKGKNGVSDEHLLVALKKINITAYMTGAVQAKLNQGNLCRIPFLIPSQTICEVFGKSLEALYGKVRLNSDESSSLSQIRDSLLPRLLSGRMTADEGIFA